MGGSSDFVEQKHMLDTGRVAGTPGRAAGCEDVQYYVQEEGPAGENKPPRWRCQALRRGADGGKARYANRGGKNKEYYAQLARTGRVVHVAKDKAEVEHGQGQGQGDDFRAKRR